MANMIKQYEKVRAFKCSSKEFPELGIVIAFAYNYSEARNLAKGVFKEVNPAVRYLGINMNAQEAARILAKENDSVVVVGIRREATGDLISDECFLNLDEFHAAVVCANLVGYILKIQKRKNSIDHILKGVKQLVDVGIPLDEKTERGL